MRISEKHDADYINTLKMLVSIVDESEVGIYVTDYHTCEILFVSWRIAKYAGVADVTSLIGKHCWTLINPEFTDRCPFCPYGKLIDAQGKPTPPYKWELYVPGMEKWFKVINEVVIWTGGKLVQKVIFYDITEMKQMQERLANLAFTDRLLQIKNELGLEQYIQNAVSKPSLIALDIDALQKINDIYSRDVGDGLLIAIRDWLISEVTEDMEVYRIGGDEFCITLPNDKTGLIVNLAQRIYQRFLEPWVFDRGSNRLRIFCNAYVAVIHGRHVPKPELLLSLIEKTLEASKGRKKVTIYDEDIYNDYKKRIKFEFSMKKCVRENMDGFDVYYQPIVNSKGKWHGVEALCRWNCPELGPVSPFNFIPHAERLGLIGAIGLWVLETAVSKCKELGLDRCEDFILDVNASPIQFLDEAFADKIMGILKKYDYPGEKLCIEITESTEFSLSSQSLNTINELRLNNNLVALDDFGTGYTNFYQLKNIPVDILKIERAFISNIETDNYQQLLLHTMSSLAHSANMRVIAEGVENEMQRDILIREGVDGMQGYLYSKPLPFAELKKERLRFKNTL